MSELINIYDSNLTKIGIVSGYESLIMTRRFQDVGEFEFYIDLNRNDTEKLQRFNIIRIGSRGDRAGIILHRELPEDEEQERLFIKGLTLNGLTRQRQIVPNNEEAFVNFSGTQEEIMKAFVNNTMINPVEVDRKISYLRLSDNKGLGTQDKWRGRFEYLSDKLNEIAVYSNLGYEIYLHHKNNKDKYLLFDVKAGVDRRNTQRINPRVVLSTYFGNIRSSGYISSSFNEKNVIYAGGSGEYEKKLIQKVGNNRGIERIEGYEEFSSIDDVEELKTLANQKLEELKEIETFTTTIEPFGSYKYEEDYYLGDYLTLKDNRLGIEVQTQLLEVREIWDHDGFNVETTFGKLMPTFFSKVQSEVKGILDIPSMSDIEIPDIDINREEIIKELGFEPAKEMHNHIKYEEDIAYLEHNKASNLSVQTIQNTLQKSIDGKSNTNHTHASYEENISYLQHNKADLSELVNIENKLQKSIDGKSNTSHTHASYEENISYLQHNKADLTELVNVENKLTKSIDDKISSISIPSRTSQLTNDSNFITNKDIENLSDGLMAKEDKSKLDGIEAGANKYTHPSNHPYSILTGVPTKLSDFSKDINFDERYYTENETDTLLGDKTDKTYVDSELGKKQNSLGYTPVNKSGDTMTGQLGVESTTFPVVNIARNTSGTGGNLYGGARLQRKTTNPTNGVGIGFYFQAPNSNKTMIHAGMFGGALGTIQAGSEKGEIVFGPSYAGQDPYTRRDLVIRAISASKAEAELNGKLTTDNTVYSDAPNIVTTKKYVDDGLDSKVNNSRVLTDVPINAKFTDTTYSEITTAEIDAGTSSTLRTITGRRIKYVLDKVQNWINSLTKADVGLSNVDNTSDLNKPISSATQIALDNKADKSQVLTNVPLNAKFTDTIYTHPTSHPASMITESVTRRFVGDTEKNSWNSKAEISDIPTRVGQLQNDKNYVTHSELGEAGLGDMSKGVYDTNNNGKVDIAEVAETVIGNEIQLGGRFKIVYNDIENSLDIEVI